MLKLSRTEKHEIFSKFNRELKLLPCFLKENCYQNARRKYDECSLNGYCQLRDRKLKRA